ncbi:uncharacterized protein LOC118027180 [Mirounga leonina]|uniref:uncharacterized protein LOC118027180 n=1 Tax=Mirounga leonina TaxID=9715 RepID=UPI00156BE85B|nr:uncharacterized protein LOC118027180 [Mirounga leonina]
MRPPRKGSTPLGNSSSPVPAGSSAVCPAAAADIYIDVAFPSPSAPCRLVVGSVYAWIHQTMIKGKKKGRMYLEMLVKRFLTHPRGGPRCLPPHPPTLGLGSRGPVWLHPAGAFGLERLSQHLGPTRDQIVTSEGLSSEEGRELRRPLAAPPGLPSVGAERVAGLLGRRKTASRVTAALRGGLGLQCRQGRGPQPLSAWGPTASCPRACAGGAPGARAARPQGADESGATRPEAAVGPLCPHGDKGTAFVENRCKETRQPRGPAPATLGAAGSPGPPLQGRALRLQPGFPCEESSGPRTGHREALHRFEPQLSLEGS